MRGSSRGCAGPPRSNLVSVISGPRSNGFGGVEKRFCSCPPAAPAGRGPAPRSPPGLRRQPQLEQVAGRHRAVAADHHDLAHHRLQRRRRGGVLGRGAGEQAAQEPAGAVDPGEPDRAKPRGGLPGLGRDVSEQLGPERPLALLAAPARALDLGCDLLADLIPQPGLRLGAANACSCNSLSWWRTVTQAPCCSANTSWMSVPSSTGTWRLPRSTRGRSECGSSLIPRDLTPGTAASSPTVACSAPRISSACSAARSGSRWRRRRPNTAHLLQLPETALLFSAEGSVPSAVHPAVVRPPRAALSRPRDRRSSRSH